MKSLQPVQAVIFDLDDTLFPEHSYTVSGYAAVASAFRHILGDPDRASAEMRALYGSNHRGRVFNVLCERRSIDSADEVVSQMITAYRTHRPVISLHPDAERALTRLEGHYRLGLISDGPLPMQQAKVDALRLADRLEEIILTDRWGRAGWKPNPRAFETVAAALGVAHAACVYVGDNPAKDFIAPRQLGWRTIRIGRPGGVYAAEPAPPGGEPHATIASLDELDALLV